jgi:hypothetical protein
MSVRLIVLALAFAASTTEALGDDFPILFTNVNVFDGVNEELIENANVFVVGNRIAEVSTEPLAAANARTMRRTCRFTRSPGRMSAPRPLLAPRRCSCGGLRPCVTSVAPSSA